MYSSADLAPCGWNSACTHEFQASIFAPFSSVVIVTCKLTLDKHLLAMQEP